MEIIATAAGNEPIIARAFAAYYRAGNRQGHTGNEINIPANTSYLCEHDGMHYVVLENVNGVLAVYRVRNDGVLKGLKRWPKKITRHRNQHSHTTGVPEMTKQIVIRNHEVHSERSVCELCGFGIKEQIFAIRNGPAKFDICEECARHPEQIPQRAREHAAYLRMSAKTFDALSASIEAGKYEYITAEVNWSALFPQGRTVAYEGDDPEGFRQQIITEFGFDPAEKPGFGFGDETPMSDDTWSKFFGWVFHCPPEHLDAIYGGNRFPMGS